MGVGPGGEEPVEAGGDREAAPPAGEPAPRDDGAHHDAVDQLLGARNRAIIAVVFAALYIVTFGPRTGWAGGIVSGALGGVVIFLLLREVDARRRRRRR